MYALKIAEVCDLRIKAFRYDTYHPWESQVEFGTRPLGLIGNAGFDHTKTNVWSWVAARPRVINHAVTFLRLMAEINRRDVGMADMLNRRADYISANPPRFKTITP